MGYCMSQINCYNFLIKKSKIKKALEAIKNLAGKESITDSSGRHFAWVSGAFASAETLQDALNDWRWTIDLDEKGNVISLNFDGEKLGDDAILLKVLAPFVEHGEIEMEGEEGSRWKWVFQDKKLKELTGRTVYEES